MDPFPITTPCVKDEPPLLPDPAIETAVPLLRERLRMESNWLRPGSRAWPEIFDETLVDLFNAHIREAGGDEGTLWILDEAAEALIPSYNNGPDAASWVGIHRQPLTQGIVSSVFITQCALSESWVHRNREHDSTVDQVTRKVTAHMIAVPLFYGGEPRGVISAVKLRAPREEDPPAFDAAAFKIVTRLSQVIGEMFDARLRRLLLSSQGL